MLHILRIHWLVLWCLTCSWLRLLQTNSLALQRYSFGFIYTSNIVNMEPLKIYQTSAFNELKYVI